MMETVVRVVVWGLVMASVSLLLTEIYLMASGWLVSRKPESPSRGSDTYRISFIREWSVRHPDGKNDRQYVHDVKDRIAKYVNGKDRTEAIRNFYSVERPEYTLIVGIERVALGNVFC